MHSVFACSPLVQQHCQMLYRKAAGMGNRDLPACLSFVLREMRLVPCLNMLLF